MRKVAILALFAICALPLFGQKMTKEERAAAAKGRYEAAMTAINEKAFVLVPSEYTDPDGEVLSNDNNSVFLSYEKENAFGQGRCVTDNTNDNIGEVTKYDVVVDKKGNVKITMIVSGRMWKGTYKISMRNGDNEADVIFTPNGSGTTRRFHGPIVPMGAASYNKHAHPI
jgi:hypothetical protein